MKMNFEDIFKAQEEERKHEMTNNTMQTPSANAHLTAALGSAPVSENNEESKASPSMDETIVAISAAPNNHDTLHSPGPIKTEQKAEEDANENRKDETKSKKVRSSAQSSPKKSIREAKVEIEKRGANFRSKPSIKAIERMERVDNQRMFLLHRERDQGTTIAQNSPSSSRTPAVNDTISEQFIVTGSTGYVYTVNIDQNPRCNCPDWKKNDGNPCKHTMFVFLRVLGVSKSSYLWYQKCLVSDELRQIFANARPDPATSNSSLRSAYFKAAYGIESECKQEKSMQEDVKRRIPQKGDLCPICYEEFEEKRLNELIFCESSCGNPLHKKCAIEWAKSMRKPFQGIKCIYCRGLMANPITRLKGELKVTQKGEYMNVGGFKSGYYGDR